MNDEKNRKAESAAKPRRQNKTSHAHRTVAIGRPTDRIRQRKKERPRRGGIIVVATLLTALAVFLSYSVYQIQIVRHAEFLEQAANLHIRTVTEYPDRGSIFDRNGSLLARTTYVSTIGVTPRDVRPWNSINVPDEQEIGSYAAGIAEALNLDAAEVKAILLRTTDEASGQPIEYAVLKKDASRAETEALQTYQTEQFLGGIAVDVETRRYYPLDDLAAQLIGFTHIDQETLRGVSGLEATYDAELAGQPGYQYSETENILGGQLPFSIPTSLQAKDGYSLQLTLDMEIQKITQQAIRQAAESSQLPEGAVGIVMDPYTGEVLAMAQYPSFDLNNPSAMPMGQDAQAWDPNSEENMEYLQSVLWRNRAISNTFEAGSTFKSLTASMAFDEGLAYETELFSDEEIIYDGWSLHCWSHPSNHGIETLERALWNSCNPVFVQLSMRVGLERFYQYIHAFGFGTTTGIGLPGEEPGIMHDDPTEIDMYTMAYGTSATVTPIQLINAYNVIANGGKLMKPMTVRALLNEEGQTVRTYQPETIRQVISEKTASRVSSMMEGVVLHGSASPAYVEGYTIAAKTGTTTRKEDGKKVASIVAMAPADKPEISVVVILYGIDYNEPTIDAARAAGSIISQVLEYRNVPRQYSETDEYLLQQTTAVPELAGMTYAEARHILAADRFEALDGSLAGMADSTVIHTQSPASGTKLHKNSIVVLYPDESLPDDPVPLPGFIGLTVSEAARYARQCGLNIRVRGSGLGVIVSQDPDPDEIPSETDPDTPDENEQPTVEEEQLAATIQRGGVVSIFLDVPEDEPVEPISGQDGDG